MRYTAEIITGLEDFLGLESIWNNLLSQSPTNTYFMRWEWLSNWWDIYSQPDDQLNVIVIKDGNAIVCIAPFYTRKRYVAKYYPSRLLMFLGTQYHGKGDACSDFIDLIYINNHGDERALVDIVFEQINNKNVCDEIYLSKIDMDSVTMKLFFEHTDNHGLLKIIREKYVSPYITLPDTWDGYMDGISASMRYKIRREQRKLEKNYSVNFRRSENLEELGADYNELIRMHTEWWETRNIDGAFSDTIFRKFHERLMPIMLKNGHLDLHFMREGEKNLAVLYLIKYDKKVYFYQSGIESSEKKSSFGYIMHSYCIDDAIKASFAEYDFLPDVNTNGYKQKYTKRNRDIADVYLCSNKLIKTHVVLRKYAAAAYRSIKKTLELARPNYPTQQS